MLTEEDIKSRLKEAGIENQQADMVIADVLKVISSKALERYFSALPEIDRAKLRALGEKELANYINENKKSLPPVSDQEFLDIYQQTWEEYFASII